MRRLRSLFVVASIIITITGCDRLASLQNPNVRIAGEWQKIQMSFPSDDVYDFSDKVITVGGIEQGTYRFESNSMLEVTLNGSRNVYEIEFVDDSNMVWYRKTSKGRDRVSEWVRAK